jgi:hypothetical protein
MTHFILAIALLLAYLVFRIGRDLFRSYQCLDEQVLREFLYRRLPRDSAEYRHVIQHLSRCETCQERLRDVQRGKRLEDHLIDDEDGRR